MVRFTITGAQQFYLSWNDGKTWIEITGREADIAVANGAELILT